MSSIQVKAGNQDANEEHSSLFSCKRSPFSVDFEWENGGFGCKSPICESNLPACEAFNMAKLFVQHHWGTRMGPEVLYVSKLLIVRPSRPIEGY